ncbi:glycerol-3-phosphate dehydrogenase/oxidase [Microbacterium sp. cx-55]|uniref:glycerol-3-phosphate dehydrogenase/oxidase n=1 Tax=Microbacterium sp. cx-55 TaxID=2875948 RepID=UPI001CBEEEC5|nr:glycerol-3-phosphate dehydrogenase/oxidase [Microbacterium sp. cx-55]MBZ4487032.1 glycerol-3-phosphate dehydrogenase/oxidase [Microbacterium sp. cx-55]UGB35950.1 glycerol-3-phosphate dehydrogenase/oxidase [Microbacterium sp. cx-55]
MTTDAAPRRSWQQLVDRPHAEVLIVGGGINGLATFRDLAMQGIDVALVERDDFVSGASAASSHMIHGGIRYLENGEFRLVHEAVVERNGLLQIAPHYVRPLQTTIPISSTFSGVLSAPFRFLRHGAGRPKERGAVLIKIGLVIYDSFSRGGGQVARHAFHGRTQSRRILPELNPSTRYTASYWDASLHDPERLALDVLQDGITAGRDRARAANYVAAVEARDGAVLLQDAETGAQVEFTASVVVNASGPWTDLTNADLGAPTHYMGGTKGSHIVLDNPALLAATGGREIFFEHSDGRIVLIYPLKGRVLVGTTDLEHDMRDEIICTDAEVDYFFELIGHVFPRIEVDREQIVYRFSGVRPLPGHGDLAPGFVSRDYRIESSPLTGSDGRVPVLSLVGGKWTTFRALAENLSDRVLEALGADRRQSTAGVQIGGGIGYPTTDRRRARWVNDNAQGLPAERVAVLLDRYGTRATEVITAIVADADDAPLSAAPNYSTAELRHLARAENVVHLADLLLRRTSLAFTGEAVAAAAQIADAVAPALGWDAPRVAHEVQAGIAAVRRAEPHPVSARSDETDAEPASADAGTAHAES